MSNSFPTNKENVPNTPQFSQVSNSTAAGYAPPAPRTSVLSIVGLVFAFLSPIIGLILSVTAWILSKSKGNKTTVAIVGTVISLIGTAISFYFALVVLPNIDLEAIMNSTGSIN